MVQPAQSGKGVNPVSQCRRARDGSTLRCIFRQPQVCPVLVVIAHILGQQPFQVPFVQDDDVVQQVPPATPTQRSATPFCHGLRKAVRTGSLPMALADDATSLPNFES